MLLFEEKKEKPQKQEGHNVKANIKPAENHPVLSDSFHHIWHEMPPHSPPISLKDYHPLPTSHIYSPFLHLLPKSHPKPPSPPHPLPNTKPHNITKYLPFPILPPHFLPLPHKNQKSSSEVSQKMSSLFRPMPILLPPSRFKGSGASANASASASTSSSNNQSTTGFEIVHSTLYGGVSNSQGSPYIIVQPVNEALSEALSENAVMPNIQPMFSLGLPEGYSNLEAFPPSYSNYMPTTLPPEYVNYAGQSAGSGGGSFSTGLNENYIIWGLIALAVIVIIVLIVVAVKK